MTKVENWMFYPTIILYFLMIFFLFRLANAIVIGYVLNNSNKRKRKKGQNFLDWLFYRRFKGVLPKLFVWNYYLNFFVCISVLIGTVAIDCLGFSWEYMRYPLIIYVFWTFLSIGYIYINWFDWKKRDIDPSKIVKKRGNKDKK